MTARILRFLREVIPGILKPARSLWNEIVGFFFLCLAGMSVSSGYRHIRDFKGDTEGFFRIILTAIFFAVMLGFAISSFLRARRISRS